MKVHGSMKKREEKEKETPEGLEKKEREEEIAMLSKEFIEKDHTKGVSIPSTIIHTRAHLDLIV